MDLRPCVLLCIIAPWLVSAATPPRRQLGFHCSIQSELCGWSISWKNDVTGIERDGDTLRISNAGDGVGFLEKTLRIGGPQDLRLVTLSALVKPTEVKAKGAGLTLAFLASDGGTLANHDMGYGDYGMAQGTGRYRKLTIVAAAPASAVHAKPGIILYGPGEAHFKDVHITVQPTGRSVSAFARRYVDAAANIMQEHSLVRDRVNFARLREEGYRIAGNARTPEQAYPAVRYMIAQLADHHSFFFSREEIAHWKNGSSGGNDPVRMPVVSVLGGFGYLKVPGFNSDVPKQKAAFAQTLQDGIRELTAKRVKGWIVDLRENDGGNMFPMLAGLSALFDQPVLGYLVDGKGHRESWGVGTAGPQPNDKEYVPVTNPTTLPSRMPIAVLSGPRTGSSGEIVILSFIGNAKTRSFGQPSWGLTTGNGIFPMPDGSELRLASTHMADRSGHTYEGPVTPDVVVKASEASQDDPVVTAATKWLQSQSGE